MATYSAPLRELKKRNRPRGCRSTGGKGRHWWQRQSGLRKIHSCADPSVVDRPIGALPRRASAFDPAATISAARMVVPLTDRLGVSDEVRKLSPPRKAQWAPSPVPSPWDADQGTDGRECCGPGDGRRSRCGPGRSDRPGRRQVRRRVHRAEHAREPQQAGSWRSGRTWAG